MLLTGLAATTLGLASAIFYDYRKHFQAFQHESVAEIITDFEADVEEDSFHLEHVISGRDALTFNSARAIQGDSQLAFDLSLLQIPEKIVTGKLPGHNMKFSSGFSSWMELYSRHPEVYGDQRVLESPSLTPRPNDHETITNFAMMCSNAYILHSILGDWRNMTDWNQGQMDDFGWDGTGLRGYIFANPGKSIIIIAFKGTSTMFGGGDTVAEDKYIDNIMFSCCCARVDISWTPVCGCYLGSNRCNQTCLQESVLSSEVSYYNEAKAVVILVKKKYPRAQLWFTGHSMGGAIAALMAITFPRTAAVTWESPGASLYGQRLGLHGTDPKELSRFPIWNYGVSTDPIFLGTCTGVTSSCYLSGYAMESKCRQGQDCLFDLESRLVNINSHRIDWVIEHILMKPEKHPLPACFPPVNCTECEDWSFVTGLEEKDVL